MEKSENKVMMPVIGEWVMHEPAPESESIIQHTRPIKVDADIIRYINESKDISFEDFRPVTLDDFAIKIEGYGKVWVVDYEEFYMLGDGNNWDGYYTNMPKQWAIIESFIRDRQVTVIPLELWEKLSKQTFTGRVNRQ